jgi:hypothetical protein
MIASLSPLILGNYDVSESTLRLYRHDSSADLAAAAPDFTTLLSTTNRTNDAENTALQNLFDELSTTNASPFGTTYNAAGASTRITPSTILVGYG